MSTSTGDIAFQLASARRALNARAARTLSKKRHGNCRTAGLSFQYSGRSRVAYFQMSGLSWQ